MSNGYGAVDRVTATAIFLRQNFHCLMSTRDLSAIGCIMLDRTEQKQAEARRFELEEQYRALVNQSLVGIYIHRKDDRVGVSTSVPRTIDGVQRERTDRDLPLSVCMPPEEYTRIREQIAHRYAEKS